jgi:hypothetical protein
MGHPAGELDDAGIYTNNSVLGRAQKTLMRFHRLCNPDDASKPDTKSRHKVPG